MSDQAPAYARTGTPIGAGAVIVFVAHQLGWNLTTDQALLAAPIVMYGYYALGRALEAYDPRLGWVLGFAKQPAYSDQPPPQEPPVLAEDQTGVKLGDGYTEWSQLPVIHGGNAVAQKVPLNDLVAPSLEDETPVQTDNTERTIDGPQPPETENEFTGEMR